MKLIFSRRAQADIERIHRYLIARSPVGAANVAAQMRSAIEFIAGNAEGAVRTDIPRIHAKWVRGYPYKIFYERSDDVITILHVRHTSRRAAGAKGGLI